MNSQRIETYTVDATDASQSAIGTSTAIDYNLASIQKTDVIIIDPVVYVSDYQFEPENV